MTQHVAHRGSDPLPNVEKQAVPQVPGQRRLTDAERLSIEAVREQRRRFVRTLEGLGMIKDGKPVSRDAALAVTHIEDAEYRAVRHITGGPA